LQKSTRTVNSMLPVGYSYITETLIEC